MAAALLCSAAAGGQYLAARAARDALYLSHMSVATLPTVVVAAALVSGLLLAVTARTAARASPVRIVTSLFAISTVLLFVEWALLAPAPRTAVVLLYLHMAGLGPMLGSGVWLLISEQFDPRTAKRRFGHIQAAGTVGGLIGGLAAERVAALVGMAAVLPLIAALNMLCAWAAVRLAGSAPRAPVTAKSDSPDIVPPSPESGLRVLMATPYLRHLAAIMVLGTVSATIIDVLFKTSVAGAFDNAALLRFFSWYYAGTAVVALVLQLGTSRLVLERVGLGWATASPSLVLTGGSFLTLWAPGMPSFTAVRGVEAVVHASWYRAAYEVLFVPLSPKDRRATKSLIDVGGDRLGDALGGIVIRLVMLMTPHASSVLPAVALGVSATAAAIAVRVRLGYVRALEQSLVNRAGAIELPDIVDSLTRMSIARARGTGASATLATGVAAAMPSHADTDATRLDALHAEDRSRVVDALRHPGPITRALVPAVMALLARDDVSDEAARALGAVADAHVDLLVGALCNPDQRFAIRRRLPNVLKRSVSQAAVDGLLDGLSDQRFEVRFRCARALLSLTRRAPQLRLDAGKVMAILRQEIAVGQDVWQGRRLIDHLDREEGQDAIDEYLRTRADRALGHVMTLLCLVMPHEPLPLAFGGLQAADAHVRGTALEYLESVLPEDIRTGLWQFLEDERPATRPVRTREQIVADLLGSHQSIASSLEQLRRGGGSDR